MLENMKKHAVVLVMVLAVLGYSGCILSPTEEPPDKPASDWKDLTQKEDVITNLVQSYTARDITHFKELLHEDYLWYNQTTDALEVFWERADDIQKTKNMFDAANRTYSDEKMWIDQLELKIATSSNPDLLWTQIPLFNDEACDDCWQTMRAYNLTVVLTSGAMTYYGDDNVQLIIKGVEKDGKKIYQLARADDINK